MYMVTGAFFARVSEFKKIVAPNVSPPAACQVYAYVFFLFVFFVEEVVHRTAVVRIVLVDSTLLIQAGLRQSDPWVVAVQKAPDIGSMND